MRLIFFISIMLLAACEQLSDIKSHQTKNNETLVDICDTRKVNGTCLQYSVNHFSDWYKEYVKDSCPKYRRDTYGGVYVEKAKCPSENRVARCLNIIEDESEKYIYDKHYYTGVSEGFDWKPANIKETCENINGRFVKDIS